MLPNIKIPAKYRTAVYAGTVVFVAASMVFGAISPDKFSLVMEYVKNILASLAALIALANVTPDDAE